MDKYTIEYQIQDIDNKINQAETLLADSELGIMAQEEIKTLKIQREDLSKLLQEQVSFDHVEKQDSNLDKRNVIFEVKGAAGGDEAKIWAKELLRMYTMYAQQKRLRI